MIEWKSYANGLHTGSHITFLLTDGHGVFTGFHASTPNGYKWHDINLGIIEGVTHYAEINLPKEV